MARMKRSSVLRPATGIDDQRAWIDRYIAGNNWLAFYRREFSGVMFWGDLSGEDLLQFSRFLRIRSLPPARPHPSLVDIRFLRHVDVDVLEIRRRLLDEHAEAAMAYMTRCAILTPPGQIAALAIGLQAMFSPVFREEFFVDPVAALRWLDREHELPLVAELEHLRLQTLGLTPLLARLRALLDQGARRSIRDAARALGVSTRTLQRGLAEIGTSYQDELTLATVRNAQRLLMDSAANVTQVAQEVGCSSSQHLSRLFQRVVGEPPTRWRSRHARAVGQ